MSGLEPALAVAAIASAIGGTAVSVSQSRQQAKAAKSLRNAGDQQRNNLRRTRTAFASMAARPTSMGEPFRKQVTGDAPSGS